MQRSLYSLQRIFTLSLALAVGSVCIAPAHAADTTSKAPFSQRDIDTLIQKIDAEPANLDNYFEYAKIAEAIGEHQKAAAAYETMLKLNPELDRVRLDLGMAYIKLSRKEDARAQLETVLKRNPPEQVKRNIEYVLSSLNANESPKTLSGFVQIGFTSDSNANSAPGSGSVTVFDTSLPLEGEAKRKRDTSMSIAAGIQHRYQITPDNAPRKWDWNTGLTAYQSMQRDQDQLDIKLLNLRMGPSVTLPDSRTTIGLAGGITVISLDGHHYLDVYSAELTSNTQITDRFSLEPAITYEYRDFHNAPNVSTYEDRTGPAYQIGLTGRYLLTEKDMLDANLQWRREDTQQRYYNNEQYSANIGHTHLFEYGIFSNLRAGVKRSLYDQADLLLSTRNRNDFETYGQILLGKNFENNMNISLSYMYRNVDSSLQNYAYDNHRFMLNTAYKF